MKKSILALVVFGAFAGSAVAQSSVAVYGVVDAGVVSESSKGASKTTKLSSGVQSESRIGFRGTENLGGGVKALFQIESGLNLDDGSSTGGLTFGRQSYVGLSSDALGTVTAGRQFNSIHNTLEQVGDPFQLGLAGKSTNIFSFGGLGGQVDSSVKYATPSFGGFSGDVIYGFGEVAGGLSKQRTVGGSAGFADKALNVRVAYNRVENVDATMSERTGLVAGSYDFGMVKAHAAFAVNKDDFFADSRDVLVGATVPFGASKVMVSYVHKEDRSVFGADATQYGVGYQYDLSKRTNAYASYARISNKNGAGFTVGNNSDDGTGDRAFNIGVRHSF